MEVGFVQFAPRFGDKEWNLKRVARLISNATEADLLVLPELCNTGYVFRTPREVEKLSEPIPDGPSTSALERMASEHSVHIVAGIAEREGRFHYNSALLVSPEGFVGIYRKTHLYFREKKFFKPGRLGFPVFNTGKGNVGIMICYDWIFPEVARTLALKGADIICHPSNLVKHYCMKAMLTRSIENMVFSITTNRIGKERGITFHGESQVVGPTMKVLLQADDKESAQTTTIDPKKARDKHYSRLNDIFKDREPRQYESLVQEHP